MRGDTSGTSGVSRVSYTRRSCHSLVPRSCREDWRKNDDKVNGKGTERDEVRDVGMRSRFRRYDRSDHLPSALFPFASRSVPPPSRSAASRLIICYSCRLFPCPQPPVLPSSTSVVVPPPSVPSGRLAAGEDGEGDVNRVNDIRTDETDDRRVTRIINLRCYTVVTGEPDVVTRDGE